MAAYQLTASMNTVLRTADNVYIPNNELNADWYEYQVWLANGGVPDPYIEPPAAPIMPTDEQEVLYDHENRLRVIEGLPPMSTSAFLLKLGM